MRLFQNSGIYRSYRPRLAHLTKSCTSFADAIAEFLNDRFGAAHFLLPVLNGDRDAFFANGDDEFSQRMWAREQGMAKGASLDEILRAQIEHHRTEVFYNLDPMRYGDAFLARLPGCVRRTIAWRAAPSAGGAFLKHDVIVNNFPTLLQGYRDQGTRAEYFAPGHDPEMDAYAAQINRPIDILFVGGYSRHHAGRARMLDAVAQFADRYNVVMCLDQSRLTRLAETPLGWIGPFAKHRRSVDIRAVARPPVFGRALLSVLGQAKIVVNGAIDMAGQDRGNMRVWEALGCGAALVTDDGNYPEAMHPDIHFSVYREAADAAKQASVLIENPALLAQQVNFGGQMIREVFSKSAQWARFEAIVE